MNLTKLLSQGLVAEQQTKLLVRAKESNQHAIRFHSISRIIFFHLPGWWNLLHKWDPAY